MYFELKNIGAIKEAKIELGELTVICGKNNTGKTYITYSIYGFLYKFHSLFIEEIECFKSLNFKNNTSIDLKALEYEFIKVNIQLNSIYTKQLKDIFNVNSEEFFNSQFNIHADFTKHPDNFTHIIEGNNTSIIRSDIIDNYLKIRVNNPNESSKYLFKMLFHRYYLKTIFSSPHPFIVSAERTGIQLFQKELDKHKNDLIKELTKTHDLDLLEENLARFALPIENNINFTRDYYNLIKLNSFLKKEHPELVNYIEEMLGIEYAIVNGNRVIIDKKTGKALPYYMASASALALFDLHVWLKHKAQKGDILFIDEPELNLHPGNQIKIARLLVKLINVGIKVFITTHSDYIIKELNNLLMLSNEFPEKTELMKEYDYQPNDILQAKDLRAYITNSNGTVSQVEIDEYGMIQSGFDDAIVQINEASNKIISAVENTLES
ncbi:MAG: ATP-binding protein [Candidatus Marithrix sp.]